MRWSVFLLTIMIAQGAETMQIRTEQARDIDPLMIGYNGNLVHIRKVWDNATFTAIAKEACPGTIRYPGGTVANYWNWEIGWLEPTINPRWIIRWVKPLLKLRNRYPLENLAHGVQKVGFTPVFVLNMLDTPHDRPGAKLEHARAALRKAKALGMPIRYIELGNEYYFNIFLPKRNFPTPEDYGRACSRWIEVLRQDHPQARFAIVGGGPMNNPRNQDWTRRALSTSRGHHAVTFHMYFDSGLFGGREIADEAGEEGSVELNQDIAAMSEQERSAYTFKLLQTQTGFSRMMLYAYDVLDRKLKSAAIPDNTPLWITEWNFGKHTGPEKLTWAAALFIAVVYDRFFANKHVELVHIHNLVGATFPVIGARNPFALIRHRNYQPLKKGYQFLAGGLISKWFAQSSHGMTHATRLSFLKHDTLTWNGREMPAQLGWLFTGGKNRRAILVNLSSQSRSVETGPLRVLAYRQYHASPQTVVGAEPLQETSGQVTGEIVLPPFSVTLLSSSSPIP